VSVEIFSESRIHHPRELVYISYRDRLPEIAPYIPDIEEILAVARVEAEGGPTLHNLWRASTEIPYFARAFVTQDQVAWDDHAGWNDVGHYVDWEIRPRAFTDAVLCSGRNSFYEDGDGTRVVLTGELNLDLTKVRGLRRMVGKRVLAAKLEAFVVKMITPNLKAVNASIEQFIDEEGG
jgi:hypothetical protein